MTQYIHGCFYFSPLRAILLYWAITIGLNTFAILWFADNLCMAFRPLEDANNADTYSHHFTVDFSLVIIPDNGVGTKIGDESDCSKAAS